MKCPKCQYISFDEGERCRNCGYEFSLAVDSKADDLAVRPAPEGPMADFDLGPVLGGSPSGAGRAGAAPAQRSAAQSAPWMELPLFPGERPRDRAALTSAGLPRPPLSVRRPTPPVPRPRERSADARDLLAASPREEPHVVAATRADPPTSPRAEAPPARLSSRALAGLIDLAILTGLDLTVLHFTLRLSGLTWTDLRWLPWVPFLAFLLMLNGGYLVAFTATVGQTVGKMAAGIRVADAALRGELQPTLQQAVVRAATMVISVGTLGLGFLPALLGSDRRALHDRLAGTRVIHVE